MSRFQWLPILGLAGLFAVVSSANGQVTPYLGYVYPAGGQQGTTFQVKLGGQRLDGVDQVLVSGEGVTAKVVKFYRQISNQELTLMREQLRELKKKSKPAPKPNSDAAKVIENIEARMGEYCNRPACTSISNLAWVEVTVGPNAQPGERELRLVGDRGVSNPLAFHIGQVPEVARKPMRISDLQVLGKEAASQRKRPPEEVEATVTLPCTVNGQIASGEINWYRFQARKGQRLVFCTAARQLIPYIADAVPGWFQPVLAVYDASGKEVAYNDDFRFKPDPTLMFEVPEDGEYRFSITDAIYRGREDFVYRVTVSELPFVTNIFPLGGPVGVQPTIEMYGWNLKQAELMLPAKDAGPGVHSVSASKDGLVSNSVPFAMDTLPECFDQEPNDDLSHAQQVELPVIVNGRIDRTDDWDVFQISGSAGDAIVAEVLARRLDSPLDSMLKISDASGKLLAFNDDHGDVASGLNTHHADSYVTMVLPADGAYHIHLGDTARSGGEAYAYRLRISSPRPDFALRVVPASGFFRNRGSASFSIYAIRQDGFTGDIKLNLKDPPAGFVSAGVTLREGQDMVKLGVKTTLRGTKKPVRLTIQGTATIDGQKVTHEAVPAEDRMQAFLWRHLVPAQDLPVLVYDASNRGAATRIPPPAPRKATGVAATPVAPAKFTKNQVIGRLRQLKLLYGEWLITDEFYHAKVAECEAVQ